MIPSKMGPALPHIRSGNLTPTPERQAAYVGLALGANLYARPGVLFRGYKMGVTQYVAWTEMASVYPGLKGDLGFGGGQQMGVRYGGTGEVTTIGSAYPITRGYGPVHTLPVPDFGFGLTSVPEGSSRFYYETGKRGLTTKQTTEIIGEFKSRGLARSLPSRSVTPSAQRKRSSRARSSSRRRRQKKWCIKHKRYDYCR